MHAAFSVNKVLLKHSHSSLWLAAFSYKGRAEQVQQKPHSPQGLKYLRSVPLQKKCANSALEQRLPPSLDRDLEACHVYKLRRKTGLEREKGITAAKIKKIKLWE